MYSYWSEEFQHNGEKITAAEYVKRFYETKTDTEIAEFLTRYAGGECTSNKVRKFRKRNGYMKEQQGVRKDKGKDEGAPRLEKEEELNCMVVYAKGAEIKTLEELLEAGQVDQNVWEVERWVLNKWPLGAKAKKVSLTWENGKIQEGNIDEQGITVAAMWQVKAWLVRKVPIALFPTVQPITCAALKRGPESKAERGQLKRSLVFADPHFGFFGEGSEVVPLHNREALDVVVQVAEESEADRVDVLGDLLDLADWSNFFVQSPEYAAYTQEAIKECHFWLAEIRRALPNAKITLHEGNHGKRMRIALSENMKAAYGIKAADEAHLPPALSIPRLLALHLLDIDWIGGYPADLDWLNDKVCLSHGDKYSSGAGDTTKSVVCDSDVNNIVGHCHRQELSSRTIHLRGKKAVIQAYAPGCTCHIDGRVPSKTKQLQWQNGCAVVDFSESGYFNINSILIESGTAVYNRRLIMARDRLKDIKAAYK